MNNVSINTLDQMGPRGVTPTTFEYGHNRFPNPLPPPPMPGMGIIIPGQPPPHHAPFHNPGMMSGPPGHPGHPGHHGPPGHHGHPGSHIPDGAHGHPPHMPPLPHHLPPPPIHTLPPPQMLHQPPPPPPQHMTHIPMPPPSRHQFAVPPPRDPHPQPPPLPPPTTQLNFHPPLPPGPLPPSPQITHRLPQPPPTLPSPTPPPPPLPCTPPPLPPTSGFQGQPPLPPLPPPPSTSLPHKADVSKPPPPPLPKEPPPLPDGSKKSAATPIPALPNSAPPLPKLPFPAAPQVTAVAMPSKLPNSKKTQEDTEDNPKPIPSIITARHSFKPIAASTTLTSRTRVPCPTTAAPPPPQASTPPPPSPEDSQPTPTAVLSGDDAYDPEDPMFSPDFDSDSPSPKEDSVDSLIDKYVRRLGNSQLSSKKPLSSSILSSRKTSRHHRHREKKKKPPHSEPSPPAAKGDKLPIGNSPARPNLDARLKIMFGGSAAAAAAAASKEERARERAKRKARRSLKHFPRPPTPPATSIVPPPLPTSTIPPPPPTTSALPPPSPTTSSLPSPSPITTTPAANATSTVTTTTSTAAPTTTTTAAVATTTTTITIPSEETLDRPLSPTPSPFLSRHLYLYWHRETLKARMTSAEVKTKAAIQIPAKPQVNGQALTTPLKGVIPPLPKNLPTVPPPNYKAPIPPAPIKTLRESSTLKAEIMRNIGRMHPYKSVEGRGHGVRPNADAELEISSETTAAAADGMEEGQEPAKGAAEMETVRLVLDKIVEELKNALRQHLTKDLVDARMSLCLEERGKDS